LNLYGSVTSTVHFGDEGITKLKSFQQMYCPQLKFLSVHLDMGYVKSLTHHLVWYLELIEKFSKSLQYLGIDFFYSSMRMYRDWETSRLKAEEKALKVGSQLTNLKEMDIVFNEPKEVSVWTNILYGIRTSVEKLALDFRGHEELYKESVLLKKNYFPNLKSLSVVLQFFNLDLEKITQISNRLEILSLSPFGSFYDRVINLERIPLSLKKLFLKKPLDSMNKVAFLKKCISLRESLIVEHDQLISVRIANYLGDFLTKPNFIWKGIECRDQEELTAASALCEKLGIPSGKLYKCEYFFNCLFYDDYDFYDDDSDEDYDN